MSQRRVWWALAGYVTLVTPSRAFAVDADPYVMDTIVVTAQKRPEDRQDVPMSIQAIEGSAIVGQNLRELDDLGSVVPALQFTSIAGFPIVFIRGLGTDNFVPSADPSIATFVDGIYTPVGLGGLTSLAGLDRIEVIKGPQGTLFGRDSTGGAINLITASPLLRRVDSALEWGSNDRAIARASVAGPVTDWLAGSMSGIYSRNDADYTDSFFTPAPNRLEAGRVQVMVHGDELALTITGYRGLRSGTGDLIAQNVAPSLLGTLAGITAQEDDYSADNDHQGFNRSTQSLGYGIVEWTPGPFDAKLLGSVQRIETPYSSIDFDASPRPLAALTTTNTFSHLETAELQFLSPDDGQARNLRWLVGVSYLHSRGGADPGKLQLSPNTVGSLLSILEDTPLSGVADAGDALLDALNLTNTPLGSNGLSVLFRGILGTRTWAAYTEATYKVTDRFELTLGGRAQHEKRFLTKSETDIGNLAGEGATTVTETDTPGTDETNLAPRAVLAFRAWPRGLFYVSYSEAYKSGTYNIVNLFSDPAYIQPEHVTAVEVGAKMESADRTWRVNVAAFDSDIHHLQSGFTSLLSAGAVVFVSVPRARARGMELEAASVLMGKRWPLTLSFAGTYLDATYRRFPDGPGFMEGTGRYSESFDHSGNDIVYSPRWSGSAGIAQLLPLGRGDVQMGVAARLSDGHYSDAANFNREDSFSVVQAFARYHDGPSHLRVSVFCDNLFDERYHVVKVTTDFGRVQTLASPRRFGARLEWLW